MPATERKSSINVEVFLGKLGEDGESITWEPTPLDNVSDIPDLGGNPEQIEVTAIGDKFRRYIDGILEVDELEFTCFYEAAAFKKAQDLGAGAVKVEIDGKTTAIIKGQISAAISGFGVGDAINYTMKVVVEDIEVTVAE